MYATHLCNGANGCSIPPTDGSWDILADSLLMIPSHVVTLPTDKEKLALLCSHCFVKILAQLEHCTFLETELPHTHTVQVKACCHFFNIVLATNKSHTVTYGEQGNRHTHRLTHTHTHTHIHTDIRRHAHTHTHSDVVWLSCALYLHHRAG